jgi:hypothetical protein
MKQSTIIHGVGFNARRVAPGIYEIVTRVARQRRYAVSRCIPADAIHAVLDEWDALYLATRPSETKGAAA